MLLYLRYRILEGSNKGYRSGACLAGSEARLAGSKACLAGSKACLAGSWALEGGDGRTDERTDGRTNGKSPHSTGLRPLSGPLPKKRVLFTWKVDKGLSDDLRHVLAVFRL